MIDNDYLKSELRKMANAVLGIKQRLQQFDLLELQIPQIKALFKKQEEEIRTSICRTIGYIMGDETYSSMFGDRPPNGSCTDILQIIYENKCQD